MKHVLFAATIIGVAIGCGSKEQEITPQIKNLTEAVYASGVIIPEEEYKVVSAADGFLEKSFVKEGDTVHEGQSLFILENENSDAQVEAATQMLNKTMPVVSSSSPVIRDLQLKLDASLIRLHNDSLQHNRYLKLFEQDAVSASAYEKYKLQYETTQKEAASIQQQLRHQRLSSNIEQQQASNQVLLARTVRNNGVVKSYGTGVVYELYKKTGDMIYPNQPIALIGRGKMIARLLVDEDDLDKVKEGLQVMIKLDAYPEKTFSATIKKIYPILNKVEQSFRVDAEFNDVPGAILYGLNAEANIILRENQSALVIPKKALRKGDTVLVKENGETRKVKVMKGVEDETWVQVKSGLNVQSKVIMP